MSLDDRAPLPALDLSPSLLTRTASESIRGSVGDASTLAWHPPEASADISLDLAELPSIVLADTDPVPEHAEYRITGQLGEGGMGVVHRAWQRALEREVALKRIRDRHKRPEAVRALLTESRITGQLEHPNIVPIHGVGRDDDGNPVLVMKRVEGVPLSELVADPDHPGWAPLPSDRLRWHLETLMQVCHAVELAHSRGVIHRDLKLDNVMVGPFGEVYVLDWGIALVLPAGAESADSPALVGTPSCMAPEMLQGGPIGRWTDVYLLGAALHTVLTGRPRHEGATLGEAVASILASARQPYPGVPEELAALANRAMAARPADRFPSVRALRLALLDFLEHRESAALSAEASRLLAAVPSGDQTLMRTRLGAARFAFGQALDRWPANPRAAAGMRTVLTQLFHLELEQGNRPAAGALLTELADPEPELVAALAELDARIAADRTHVAALERLAEDHDPAHRARDRRSGLLAIGVVAGVTILSVLGVRWAGLLDPGHAGLTGTAAATAVAATVAMVRAPIGRSSEINRRIGWSVTAVVVAATIGRAGAWWADVPIPRMLAFELLSYATATALIGITVHRSFLPLTVPMLCGFAAALVLPHFAMEVASVVVLGALMLALWLWSRPDGPGT